MGRTLIGGSAEAIRLLSPGAAKFFCHMRRYYPYTSCASFPAAPFRQAQTVTAGRFRITHPFHPLKAKVEAGVQVVQRWVLAALRKRQFFSLAELNEAIGELIGKLNRRPFHKLPGTREELYRSIDVPALQPLPAQPYVFAEWKRA